MLFISMMHGQANIRPTERFNLSYDQNFSLILTLKMEAAGSSEGFAIT